MNAKRRYSYHLMTASVHGRLDVVCALLAAGADVNARRPSDGSTALLDVVIENLTNGVILVSVLCDAGAYVNARADEHHSNSETALMLASQFGHIGMVKELLKKGADVNMRDEDGKNALQHACSKVKSSGWVKQCKVEMEKALTPGDMERSGPNNAWSGRIFTTFVKDEPMSVTTGRWSLHFASRNGNLEVVKRLLEKGVDVNMQYEDGNTALISACYGKHTAVALELLGVDNIKVDLRTNDGESALHYASQNGMLEVVNRLLKKGADVNMQDKRGNTALISACRYSKKAAVALALLGVDNINVDLRTNDGKSALHYASKNGMLKVVNRLLEKGVQT